MSNPGKAVFLSYASQDAEAAKKICDALRAADVEVWFDQSELVGGDAWDQKIRGQIKACALFVPVISAATQARREGYFRIEWKLAAQRTHAFADGTPFLLPVVIDATRDADALVPEEFRAVQWTRLAGGETPPAFGERVKKLLGGEEVARAFQPVGMEDAGGKARATSEPVGRRVPAAAWGIAIVLLVVSPSVVWWWRSQPDPNAGAGTRPPTSENPVAPAAFPRDPDLRRAMELINGTEANSEDFALAEDLAKATLARRPMDAEAVTVMARVQVGYLFRGFDRSEERRVEARRFAERAVQLAPNDPEALAALGVYFFIRSADLERAHELLSRAIALKPAESFFHRFRDEAMFADRNVPRAEALAATERTAVLFPNDALAHYQLARRYRDLGRYEEMERELDRTIAITPIANAVVWKSRLAFWVRGDLAEMKALLDSVPPRTRSLERVVFSRWIYAMAAGRPEEGLAALQGLTSTWFEDFEFLGPKALLNAQLLELQGRRELARLQYEAALAEVRQRKARTPGDAALPSMEAWILHGLGRDDEARAYNRIALETVARPYWHGTLGDWWFTAIPCNLLIGERTIALDLMREAVAPTNPSGTPSLNRALQARASLRMRFKIDPRMAPFRDDPEIVALLAEPKGGGQRTEDGGQRPVREAKK